MSDRTVADQVIPGRAEEVLSLFPELEKDLGLLSYGTGALPCQEIESLVEAGRIGGPEPIDPKQIQPASLDLRLGPTAYRVQASFLPGGDATVESKLERVAMARMDLTRPVLFEKGCVYIVPLLEELRLPYDIAGKANPRSTTGRLDIFTRLIADRATEFERVPHGYRGRLYAEVFPRTFSVVLQEGVSLNQLRFVRGTPPPADAHIERLGRRDPLVYDREGSPLEPRISKGLRISIDLRGEGKGSVVGFKAKTVAPAIEFDRRDAYDPARYWDPVYGDEEGALVLNPGEFYILASRERVSVPPDAAAELVPYDPAMGEFRIHYAGFFDPGFGYGDGEDDVRGAAAVLEVRSHGVPYLLEHGQVVGRLVFERLTARPTRLYGRASGSSYQGQSLLLSKQFTRPGAGARPGGASCGT